MAGSLLVLRVRDVGLVWSSGVISAVGSGAMFVAVPYYTFVATGSVTATAAVTLAEYLPTIGIAQVAGMIVDRRDPKRVLIVANVALAACTLAYLLGDAWWWLATVALIRSCLSQFVLPASNTLLPAVAPPGRLAQVNSLNSVGGNIARLAGPALGGALLAAGGLGTVAVADAVSFAVAAFLLARLRRRQRLERMSTEGWSERWRGGWAGVRDHPVLRPMVAVMGLVGFGEGFVSALMAPWMSDIAGGTSTQLGLMLSVQALGGIVGSLLVVRYADRWSSTDMLGSSALVSGIFLIVIFNYPVVTGPEPWPAIVLTAFAGVPFAVYGTAQTVTVQQYSTDGLRGRIVTLTFGVQGVAQLVGIGVAGPAARLLGPLAINAETLAYLAAGSLAIATLRQPTARPPGHNS